MSSLQTRTGREMVSSKPTAAVTPARRSLGIDSVVWMPPANDMEHHEWMLIGRRLGAISRCSQWWLGDWVQYGTSKWGEKYSDAARATGYDTRSLANMASVALSFPPSRRRDNLTWSHHAAVAALAPEEQDLWLGRAATQRLSVADLRTELRTQKRLNASPKERPSRPRRAFVVVCPRCKGSIEIDGTQCPVSGH